MSAGAHEKAPALARAFFQADAKGRERLYRTLAMLLDNRVLLLDALTEMWGVYSNDGKRDSPTAQFLADARREIADGQPLSNAIHRWVSVEEAALLASAEKTGDWKGALHNAMRLVAAKRGVTGAVLGGLAYPVVLTGTLVYTLYVIATKLVPVLDRALPGQEWEGVTWLMFALAGIVADYGLLALGVATVVTVALLLSLPRMTGNKRYHVERVPPYSIYRVMQGAPFLVAVAVMLKAGIKLLDALHLLGTHASPYMRERIDAIKRGIARGGNLGEAMADAEFDFPDREAIRFVRLLAGREGFDNALLNYAEDWMAAAVSRVQATMRVFAILVMFGVAGVIGMTVTASFDIQQTMQSMSR